MDTQTALSRSCVYTGETTVDKGHPHKWWRMVISLSKVGARVVTSIKVDAGLISEELSWPQHPTSSTVSHKSLRTRGNLGLVLAE